MASNPLLDLLPAGREVAIGRGKVKVVDLPLSFIGKMLSRFPELRTQIAEGKATFASALMMLPEALPMFLAAGIDKAGDAEAEAIMGRLGSKDQLALLNEILIETKGSDTGSPLIERVKAVAGTLGLNPAFIDKFLDVLNKIDLEEQTSSGLPTTLPPPSNTSGTTDIRTFSNTRREKS